jgi:alkylation response protein AidB-like acyl-CoA dehydrogenase
LQPCDYSAPLADILLALEVAGLDDVLALPAYADIDRNSVELALAEFGRFASQVIAPTNQVGDREGSTLDPATGIVSTPSSFRSVYRQYVASGWGGVQFPGVYGGGGLPALVGFAIQEMMASANVALSLNPVLTQSAIELLLEWGSDAQRALYLPKLISGEWCGTMNLTEPDAGSDLGEVRTQATLDAQGQWRISGTKVFITWGEHDLADNIIHLVLARTPDSPPGTKGLSLFLVPKVVTHGDGSLGRRNSLRCLRLEDKLGIHASPTCTMDFDEAMGELIGAERGGMSAMFTMMNAARLSIGLQGPSVAERAGQLAYRYAKERKQGRATGVMPPQRSVLSDHPDVRRMLLSMRTSALAGRLLLYRATGYRDMARSTEDPARRAMSQAYVDLLTPVAKAWSSDIGFSAASTGVQILGGAGYIEDSSMVQYLRDSRIAPIYEGTNGIQAIDLVMRKLPRENGRWVRALLEDIVAKINRRPLGRSDLRESYAALSDAFAILEHTTDVLLSWIESSPTDALAGATSYLELMGLTLGGMLTIERAERASAAGSDLAARAAVESEFFASEHVTRATGLRRPILAGADRLADLSRG